MTIKHQKRIIPSKEPGCIAIEYEDFFITKQNKKATSKELGNKVASINSYFLEYLKEYNIPNAYVKKIEKNSLVFLNFDEFAFKVKVFNVADKRIAKIFSIKSGSLLDLPIFEYHFGDSSDSLITESHLISFNLCTYDEIKLMNRICSKVNAIMRSFFERRNHQLIELTCGFGKFEGKILLIDHFSPFSLKIIENITGSNLPDPHKIETNAEIKKYADHLMQLTNGE